MKMIYTDIHMFISNSTDYQVTVSEDDKYIRLQMLPDKNNPQASYLISIAEGTLDDFIRKIMAMRTELEQKWTQTGVMR
jgi:hypothetical protein